MSKAGIILTGRIILSAVIAIKPNHSESESDP